MKKRIIDFIRVIFPFVITLFLWRANIPWLNPAGMMALIPIFFCTFVRPVNWFLPFGILMCFMLDYNSGTLLYWTTIYCICYSANGFQHFVDLTRMDANGLAVFAVFFTLSVFIISVPHLLYFTNILRMLTTIVSGCILYLPISMMIKKVAND